MSSPDRCNRFTANQKFKSSAACQGLDPDPFVLCAASAGSALAMLPPPLSDSAWASPMQPDGPGMIFVADVCMAIESLTTLDLSMVVDSIEIYELKGPYYMLIMTDWFLQALSVIPRGSWGDVARRFTMVRWVDQKNVFSDSQ
ncbi:myosin heavy chain kinase B-like [Dorcoceras hygrometricum]|uniref:Myosin heavy chain kinase B-like n=1 Tax=Dorcoceras hygrometricum TaxID=472368 RepID=A0A2Z7BQY7_9LAMI|nr:myosin heavy chain kinase B-like [Dorcoceras hygrometricum]